MYEPTVNPGAVALTEPWMSEADTDVVWAFFENAPVALLAADDQRQIQRVNSRWSDLTGHDVDAAIGARIDDLLAPESRPGIELRWSDLLTAGLGTARVVLLRPDGARLAVRYGAFANVVPGLPVSAYFAEPRQGARAPRPPRPPPAAAARPPRRPADATRAGVTAPGRDGNDHHHRRRATRNLARNC